VNRTTLTTFITLLFWSGIVAKAEIINPNSPSTSIVSTKNTSEKTTIKTEKTDSGISITVEPPANNKTPAIAITVNQPNASSAPNINLPAPKIEAVSPEHRSSSKSQANYSAMIPITPTPSVDIVINDKYRNHPKVKRLYALLGLKNSPRVIHMVDDPSIASNIDNIIAFRQRTFLGILYYLRNAVQISPDMIKQGLIMIPKHPDGRFYNPTDVTKGILNIHMSKERPKCNVASSIYYRNHWFYIADNDIISKNTFMLIQLLFHLQAAVGAAPTQKAPVLTIPVR